MRVQKQLLQEYGREPTPEEVAEEILLPVDRVRAVLKMAQQPISLQAPVGESEETNFGDFIEDKGAENPSDMITGRAFSPPPGSIPPSTLSTGTRQTTSG